VTNLDLHVTDSNVCLLSIAAGVGGGDVMAVDMERRRQRKLCSSQKLADKLWRCVSAGVWEWLKRSLCSESRRDSEDYVEIFLTPPQSPQRLGSPNTLGSEILSSPERRARAQRMLDMHDCIVDDIVYELVGFGGSEQSAPSTSQQRRAAGSCWKQTCT
jgi:hypothetical protein